MHLLVILYGSRKREEVSLERFNGDQQRRVEIDMKPRLPRSGMTPSEVYEWARHFVGANYQSFKHSQKWHCEYCDKPARMSESQMMSWTHLNPPRMNIYMHFVCNPSVGPCADIVRQTIVDAARISGMPPPPRRTTRENPMDWPTMGACAGCEKDDTSKHTTKVCAGCQLTRYCSAACQKGHWREHKAFCKMEKTVTWTWD
ncbi:hypothetical protein PENSPDRAFT_587942 [Peniophora sp. CONT]|nr:hypothetical protein PENSPDRAFT_587942 [Peniophora sp. CONT]